MTKFQDPPLRSRRAVRQSEVNHGDTPEVDTPVRPATARTGRRAQLPSATEWNAGAETSDGSARIVAAPSEPFTYTTQSLPQMSPVTPEVRPVVAPVADATAVGAPTTAADKPKASQGRRVSLAAGEAHVPVVADVEPVAALDAVPDSAPTDTIAAAAEVPSAIAAVAVPADTVPAGDVTDDEPVVQRTMTRRELREIRAAAERAGELQVPEAISAILNSGPIILPYLSSATATIFTVVDREAAAEAEFNALTREPTAESAGDDETVFTAAPVSTWGMTLEPAEATRSAEDDDSDDDLDAQISAPPVAAASSGETTSSDAVPVFIDPTHGPTSARAAGHWSVRADMDEDIESLENTISRSVGTGGALTTSALVLPSVPQSSDITSPFTASGEIMATGSVDLPRSLASTGVHPSRVDTSDFDLDPLDHEVPSTDSAPVRAIRAVSTHTGSNGMVTSKKQSNRTLTVLVISASTMAVGVAGLLIAGYALQIFP